MDFSSLDYDVVQDYEGAPELDADAGKEELPAGTKSGKKTKEEFVMTEEIASQMPRGCP